MCYAAPAVSPPDPTNFWQQVRLNVVSWLIIAAVGGVGYIAYTVPRLLTIVIAGQEQLQDEVTEARRSLATLERRVTVLELRR